MITPYDEKLAKLELSRENYDVFFSLKDKREGYLAGYAAGDAAHACEDTGCPCYQRGREDAYENPMSMGSTI